MSFLLRKSFLARESWNVKIAFKRSISILLSFFLYISSSRLFLKKMNELVSFFSFSTTTSALVVRVKRLLSLYSRVFFFSVSVSIRFFDHTCFKRAFVSSRNFCFSSVIPILRRASSVSPIILSPFSTVVRIFQRFLVPFVWTSIFSRFSRFVFCVGVIVS